MIGSLNEEIDGFLSSLAGLEETALNQIKDRYSSTVTDELSKGHLTTNVCMIAASQLKKNPKELAGELQKKLIDSCKFENVETAGPGFINITLESASQGVVVTEILTAGKNVKKFEEGSNLTNVLKSEFEEVFGLDESKKALFLERLDHILADK